MSYVQPLDFAFSQHTDLVLRRLRFPALQWRDTTIRSWWPRCEFVFAHRESAK